MFINISTINSCVYNFSTHFVNKLVLFMGNIA